MTGNENRVHEQTEPSSCHEQLEAYGRGRVRHDTIFEEIFGYELGVHTGDVCTPYFWYLYD